MRMSSRVSVSLPVILACLIGLAAVLAGCGSTKVALKTPQQGQEQANEISTQSVPPVTASGDNILTNSDFADGTNGWQLWDQGGSRVHGINRVEVVSDSEVGKALRMIRSCPQNDGGAAGLAQKLDRKLGSGRSLVLTARIKVDKQEGGALAGRDPRWFPEGAVQFRVYYEKSSGEKAEWYHGFFYGEVPGADVVHFTPVPRYTWYSYSSGDISGVLGAGARITEFRVYGFGWNFDGYASGIALRMSKKES